jgi:hypothetical protein
MQVWYVKPGNAPHVVKKPADPEDCPRQGRIRLVVYQLLQQQAGAQTPTCSSVHAQ